MSRDTRVLFVAIVISLYLAFSGGCRTGSLGGQSGRTIRVLTYNIHHAQGTDGQFDYERLAKIINDLSPDIVALQEVDRGSERASGADQAALLAKSCGMYHVYGPAMPFQGGEYGQAILSRYPIRDTKVHSLPQRLGREPRIAVETQLVVDGIGPLTFIGTHLCHQDNDVRVMQTERLTELFSSEGGTPIMLAGDFNSRPGSDPMNVLLQDGWIDTIAPRSKIDYILVRASDPWQVLGVTILDEPVASDHDPVLAVLKWQVD